ncbi:amidohydrolase [Chitinibacter sp. ZOR0017]|uniref:amidohydrolase n=1 Tax=Chitinibacter sp. ZOR0017 TaxID=1339254 RepID=UPI00068A8C6D|nr:amidohydrolase [Chitinibacter sp. ZOR0017]
MKHTLLSLSIGVMLGSPVFAQTTSLQEAAGTLAQQSATTTVYLAKEFITMNPTQPRAEAIAVRDGKLLAVGTQAEVVRIAGESARVDKTFAGQVVMPGFVEQHVHPVLAALTMNTNVISIEDWDAIGGFSPAVRDPKGYQDRLKKSLAEYKAKKHGPKEAYVSWGYHHYMHGEMSRALLNQLAPDFPVIIWHRSCHEIFMNDAALKLTGITQADVARLPESAQAMVNWDKGHLFEQGMLAMLPKIAPFMASPAQFKKGLEYSEQYYHRFGITTAAEPGGFASKPVQDAINAVYSDDATPFNHYFMVDGKSIVAQYPNDPSKVIAESEKLLSWGKGRTAYMPKQVKLFSDGAIFSQLMQMTTPYTDGHHGAWIMDPPVMDSAFQTYWDAGYQLHVHNNGDAGFDVVLKSLEDAMARNPRQDHRTVLVHFGFARPEQVKRWIELGGIVSSNPYYVTALSGRYGKLGMTEQWAQNIAPHGEVLKNGGSLSFHSDMPMAPAKPLQLVWAAVNRMTYEGQVAGPQHKVPLDEALKAITINAAYSIQQEGKVGSLEVGKDANLTVLAQSPYAVEPAKLKDIQVLGTMLEGRWQPVAAAKGKVKPATLPAMKPQAATRDLQAQTTATLTALLSHKHDH